MKRSIYGICTAALLALGACTTDELPAPDKTQPDGTEQTKPVSGEVLVKFKSYVSDILDQTAARTRSGGPATRSGILSVDEVLDLVGGYEIERVFPVDPRTEARTREAGLNLWYVVRFDKEYTVEEVVERLSQLGEVQYANPNRTIKRAYNPEKKAIPLTRERLSALTRQTRAAAAEYGFNDALLPQQWHLVNRGTMFTGTEACGETKSVVGADVQCEEAWKLSTGDPSIIVAVLDEGVCLTHPDLQANIWTNEDEVDGSREDNDSNGYAGDVHGYNFVTDTGVISWDDISDTGHGTHVAGVIAAQNDNGEGISSIAGGTSSQPGVKIMSCQIFSGDKGGNSMTSVKAIKYAADNGAVVLQCSWGYVSGTANSYEWGTPGYATEEEWETMDPLQKEALDYFIHNAGSPNGPIEGGIAVFASGNEYPPRRPTSRPPHTPTTGRARRSRPREETGTTTGTIGRKATTPRAAKRAVCSRRCRSMSAKRDTATWRAPRWPARTSRASRRWVSPTPHSCAATSRPTNSRRCSTKRRPRSTTA